MNHSVSDAELDNARHEVEFCLNQINDLWPWALQIHQGRLTDENLVSKAPKQYGNNTMGKTV
ncbi:MAG TPA: hypothetical protein VKA09_01395 [Nitrososphaeraceae archaeon]|nr:hypothetical protein [Nitrososphaeraceae archaeon]